jgi:hypothetical protein
MLLELQLETGENVMNCEGRITKEKLFGKWLYYVLDMIDSPIAMDNTYNGNSTKESEIETHQFVSVVVEQANSVPRFLLDPTRILLGVKLAETAPLEFLQLFQKLDGLDLMLAEDYSTMGQIELLPGND